MRKILLVVVVMGGVLLRADPAAWGREVPYTLEDRERLIRIETALREFKDSVDKRFEQVDKRFEQMDRRLAEFQSSVDRRLAEFQSSVDKRFAEFQSSVDKRFEQMMTFMWILASVFGGLVAATIGFAVWDRRTALAPALRRSRELEEREERVERALRELAQTDPRVAEALKHTGLL